jgi:arsenate reductase
LLQEHGIPFEYREYRREPLSAEEIREVLGMLGAEARDMLRRRDKAFKELGLTGEEGDDRLIAIMADHPTLLQRPIGVFEGRAAVGRPIEKLLELIAG